MTSTSSRTVQRLRGIAAASGRVAGPIWRWPEENPSGPEAQLNPPDGRERLQRAIGQVREQLSATTAKLRQSGAQAEAGILDAQQLILQDPAFVGAAHEAMAKGVPAAQAVQNALEPYVAMLLKSDDPVFRARAADLRDVTHQVQRALRNGTVVLPSPDRPSIVVAKDLAPSQTAGLDRDQVLGFATEMGTATAHTAILARALGIPAVVGIPGLLNEARAGTVAVLDGEAGTLILDPPAEVLKTVSLPEPIASDPLPAVTLDGHRIEIACNASGVDDARRGAAAGADGIGLLRSEFLFLGRDTIPDEEEQVAVLTDVLSALNGRPVILRTLDVGADKPLPALPQPTEMNPALGVRGLRLQLLRRTDLLRDQLRAAFRVARHHPLRVMFPMVSTVEEFRQARAILNQGGGAGVPAIGAPGPELGIMVEVPSAALAADLLAAEVDFFSIGTNDLTQYVFAADRTNPELASLADSLHPVLLRLIEMVVRGAHNHRKWVGVCGEMASDPWALPLLIGLGLDELSVHPPILARVKARVRALDGQICNQIVREALELEDGLQVRHLLERRGLQP